MSRLIFFQFGVFISAFLLFSLQLITARQLLPLFGGSIMTWGTCMIFFQGLLLAGYAFAHWGLGKFGVLRYTRLHWVLLLAGLACFPLQQLELNIQGLPPTLGLLILLLTKTGICFFALSTISLVLQRWLSASDLEESKNPYILYSPSNLGSILGLLSYPFVVERLLRLDTQSTVWWVGYLLLIVVLIPCSPRKEVSESEEVESEEGDVSDGEVGSPLRWLGLSACGSALLLATTNIISFDIASAALLWVLPLTLYLLTFVLIFKSKTWFPPWLMTVAFWVLPLALVICWFGELHIVLPSMVLMGVLYLAFLFVLCMCCHGTLHKERPRDPQQLTRFYLYMSLGGFSGSVLINWLIPLISNRSIEYPLTLFLTVLLLSYRRKETSGKHNWLATAVYLVVLLGIFFVLGKSGLVPQLVFLFIGLLVMIPLIATKQSLLLFRNFYACGIVALLASPYLISDSTNLFFHRNFYGIYKIFDQDGKRHLLHGTTKHGQQYLEGSDKHLLPLAYYHPNTPSGALLNQNPLQLQRIGMIGLGSGALGAYLSEGQHMTVYELDKDNVEIADSHFTYLQHGRDRGAKIDFVVGDGRLSLNEVDDATFDLFIVDAFSSDSIPVHLVTVEAMQEYMRVVKEDGLLIMHCSNRHLDVLGLIQANSEMMGRPFLHLNNNGSNDGDAFPSDWVAFSKSDARLTTLERTLGWRSFTSPHPLPSPWTDQFSSIVDMLK